MRPTLLVSICIALFLPASSALAHQAVRLDPNDRPAVGYDPDIRSTGRVVYTTAQGVRRLRVGFRAYEPLGVWWTVDIYIDSKGGPLADYVMRLANADVTAGKGCDIRPIGGGGADRREARFRQDGDQATCSVRLSRLVHTKRIRWRLVSPSGYGAPGKTDIAPNGGGWYS